MFVPCCGVFACRVAGYGACFRARGARRRTAVLLLERVPVSCFYTDSSENDHRVRPTDLSIHLSGVWDRNANGFKQESPKHKSQNSLRTVWNRVARRLRGPDTPYNCALSRESAQRHSCLRTVWNAPRIRMSVQSFIASTAVAVAGRRAGARVRTEEGRMRAESGEQIET